MENNGQFEMFPEHEQIIKQSPDRKSLLDLVTREADDKAKRADITVLTAR